jgi:hypothetical protein
MTEFATDTFFALTLQTPQRQKNRNVSGKLSHGYWITRNMAINSVLGVMEYLSIFWRISFGLDLS